MTEKWLNETVESVVNALKIRRMIIDREELFLLMYQHENIYQLVVSKFCSEKKARLIIKAWEEINGENENSTKKSVYHLPNNCSYSRRSRIKNRI